jgi:hypothetical protein
MIEIDATYKNYPGTMRLWDGRTIGVFSLKDSTEVSLWDADTAAAISENGRTLPGHVAFKI